VHIDDSVGLFRCALEDQTVDGIVNVTSPGAVRQMDFVRAMAGVLHRPTRFPVPARLVRLVLGEQAVLLLGSRRVAPKRALEMGYRFRYPSIDEAFGQVFR
jgi:NAD dependent epimerase/dehydratase family enzyme